MTAQVLNEATTTCEFRYLVVNIQVNEPGLPGFSPGRPLETGWYRFVLGVPGKPAFDGGPFDTAEEALYAGAAQPPAFESCQCDAHEWRPDYVEIRDSRGGLHYADKPCLPQPPGDGA